MNFSNLMNYFKGHVLKWPRYYGKYHYQGPDLYESFNKVTSSSMRSEEKIKKLKKTIDQDLVGLGFLNHNLN
jgi:hypothetical protein